MFEAKRKSPSEMLYLLIICSTIIICTVLVCDCVKDVKAMKWESLFQQDVEETDPMVIPHQFDYTWQVH